MGYHYGQSDDALGGQQLGLDEWNAPGEPPASSLETDAAVFDFLSPALRLPAPPPTGLPPRCRSEPTARPPCAQDVSEDDGVLPEAWPRRVTFSERSRLHLYRPDPGCARDKSYSKAERQGFGSEALAEALRIKQLVLSAPGASAKDAFRRLLQEKELRLEEIVGLEHLVWGKSASKVLRDRKAHAQAVLKEQGKQRHLEKMAVLKEDPTETLGRFAASRSVKAAKRARIRAAMAA